MIAALLAGALALQTAPAPADAVQPGQPVRDMRGEVVGRVSEIVLDRQGRPVQVLVRTGGRARVGSSLKALPLAGLRAGPDGAVSLLTRAELESLPSVAR